MTRHVDEEDRVNSKTQGCFAVELGQRGGWLINESGLYSLIIGSKLPSAKKFKKWVTSEVLFNPYDCGKCLELKDSAVRMAISKMNNNQVKKLTNLDVKDIDIRKLNNAGENFLTESGVYKLIFKSRKESAERFQDWVTDEVLPTIRKHGAYMTDNALEQAITNPDFMIGLLQNLKKEKEEKKRLMLQLFKSI